jgi:squalene cyclase
VPAGYFASFPYERHSSVGVNLHVLHALLRVPGYPDLESTIEHLVDYLLEQQMGGLYWIDKWHISPYYATAHAVCCLRELRGGPARRVRPALDRAREWLRQTQNADGSWGFYGTPTAEETAYAVLALASENRVDGRDLRRIAAALRLLPADGATNFPPLWIDKCLYTPTLVVRAAIEAARAIGTRVVAATDFARETARPPATAALAS